MPDCNTCKENRKRVPDVPYIVHEGEVARLERIVKRLWIVVLVLIVLFVGTNAGWIWYESRYETIVVTQELDGEHDRITISGVGDVNYGENQTDSESPNTQNGR